MKDWSRMLSRILLSYDVRRTEILGAAWGCDGSGFGLLDALSGEMFGGHILSLYRIDAYDQQAGSPLFKPLTWLEIRALVWAMAGVRSDAVPLAVWVFLRGGDGVSAYRVDESTGNDRSEAWEEIHRRINEGDTDLRLIATRGGSALDLLLQDGAVGDASKYSEDLAADCILYMHPVGGIGTNLVEVVVTSPEAYTEMINSLDRSLGGRCFVDRLSMDEFSEFLRSGVVNLYKASVVGPMVRRDRIDADQAILEIEMPGLRSSSCLYDIDGKLIESKTPVSDDLVYTVLEIPGVDYGNEVDGPFYHVPFEYSAQLGTAVWEAIGDPSEYVFWTATDRPSLADMEVPYEFVSTPPADGVEQYVLVKIPYNGNLCLSRHSGFAHDPAARFFVLPKGCRSAQALQEMFDSGAADHELLEGLATGYCRLPDSVLEVCGFDYDGRHIKISWPSGSSLHMREHLRSALNLPYFHTHLSPEEWEQWSVDGTVKLSTIVAV